MEVVLAALYLIGAIGVFALMVVFLRRATKGRLTDRQQDSLQRSWVVVVSGLLVLISLGLPGFGIAAFVDGEEVRGGLMAACGVWALAQSPSMARALAGSSRRQG